jgi:hypothetical protein
MVDSNANLDKVCIYLKTLEYGTFDTIADLFADDMVIEQLPNQIYPQGVRHKLAQMAEGFEKAASCSHPDL